MKNGRPVIVVQVPSRLDSTHAREFLPQAMAAFKGDRPRVVFDFSNVCHMDSAGVEVLLKCLEAVMRADGDLKLATLRPEAAIILELTRVDRLFEIFTTVDDAVESFQGFVIHETLQNPATWYTGPFPSNGHAVEGQLAS